MTEAFLAFQKTATELSMCTDINTLFLGLTNADLGPLIERVWNTLIQGLRG